MTTADEFVTAFFGPGNQVLAGSSIDGEVGRRLKPYLQPLRLGTQTPIILPRRTDGEADAYVICWSRPQAASMRATIEAFVAHSYVAFDGRPRRLDAADPVDAAVLNLVGPDTTYVLRPPDSQHATAMWRALALLNTVMASRPLRTSPVPRPLGRMLAEFFAALAAGNAAGSAELLDELVAMGLSAVNIAYLRVHRLSRLGRDSELLQLPQLADVVASNPPEVIRDAILAAWSRLRLLGLSPDDANFSVEVVGRAIGDDRLIGALARGPLQALSPDALKAVAIAALVNDDQSLGARVAAEPGLPVEFSRALDQGFKSTADESIVQPTAEQAASDEKLPISPPPQGWVEWATRLGDLEPDDISWRDWPSPSTCDEGLTAALEQVTDATAEYAWKLVGPFLDADDMGQPAWRSAKALLILASSYDRWAPSDVATIQALLEVFLRGAPPAGDYSEVLDLLADYSGRWAVAGNALAALDMVDDVAHGPVSDLDARLRFALSVLEPLSRHRRRLPPELRWLGEQIASLLAISLDFQVAAPVGAASEEVRKATAGSVLLYSLDEGVLQRTAERLKELFPQVTIQLSNDRVGSTQLRSHARGADVIALATRCAKHAATGFIRDHANERAVIVEADGAGSVSLIRAVVDGLEAMIP